MQDTPDMSNDLCGKMRTVIIIIVDVRRMGLSTFRIILILTALRIPTPSADRYVKKWLEEGKLEKVEHGKYRKRLK